MKNPTIEAGHLARFKKNYTAVAYGARYTFTKDRLVSVTNVYTAKNGERRATVFVGAGQFSTGFDVPVAVLVGRGPAFEVTHEN